MNIYTLHGFLGSPRDWNSIIEGHHVDLFQPPLLDFSTWAQNFNTQAKQNTDSKRVLIGYSLGGRLALYALDQDPEMWDAAVIISTNPGLTSEEAKQARKEHDEKWAKRFETEEWDSLMRAWNGQGVFTNTMERHEKDYSREVLANSLRQWSLGGQKNFFPRLSELSLPILWIAGQNDDKFATLAQSVTLQNPKSKIWIAPDAGHRVPWEQTEAFQKEITTFLGETK